MNCSKYSAPASVRAANVLCKEGYVNGEKLSKENLINGMAFAFADMMHLAHSTHIPFNRILRRATDIYKCEIEEG